MEMIYKDPKRGVEVYRSDLPPTSPSAVDLLIETFQQRIPEAAQKMSISDYVRLLQLQQELSESNPHEIEVTWIETPASETTTLKSPPSSDGI